MMAWKFSWGTHQERKEREKHMRSNRRREALDEELSSEDDE